MERLNDASIDAVITDFPYGTMNAKWDRGLDLVRWWDVVRRKLKPTGIVAGFAAGRFLFELHASNPQWFRYDLIWEKHLSVGFLDANHRPLRAHEYILIFSPRPKSAVYNPQKTPSGVPAKGECKRAARQSTLYRGHAKGFTWNDDGTRHPRSVLRFDSVGRGSERGHPTQKPLELLRWLVRSYTRRGGLVCDPCFGSGTTAEACAIEGRRFLGFERERRFFNFAARRLKHCRK